MSNFRLVTLDPGHFHAALVHKEMYPGVSKHAAVYAPLTRDLADHIGRVARFNTRATNPTAWEVEVYAAHDFLERMLSARAGDVVVLSGRNRRKIEYIRRAVEAGLHVLADKPWIIRSEDWPVLQQVMSTAESKGLIAYDIMTERYEITTMLQLELVNEPAVFGTIAASSPEEPAVYMESVHHIWKTVAGAPNLRPTWFFDIEEQGEALADVGTHLVDLTQWTLFPESVIDPGRDVRLISAKRWPTTMSAAQMRQVTGEPGDALDYYCNTQVTYTVRGAHTKLDVLWRWEAPAGTGDTHYASYRGSKSRVEVRQGEKEKYQPELYVVPGDASVCPALERKVEALTAQYPGIGIQPDGAEFRVTIPDRYRVGHEAHFAQVTNQFLAYLEDPKRLPGWENPNMLAKYYVTTQGVDLSRAAL
jgi:predicted dehydrogenase